MALSSNIIGAFSALDGAAITVRQDRCAKVRNRNVSCLKCAEACTTGCISLVDGRLTIDADSCVGCGTCATACPTCALEARNPSDAQLLNECLNARENNQVTIACKLLLEASEGLVDVRKMAMVVCSGRVEESLICGLVTHGVKNIVIACGACDRCAQKHGQAMSLTVAESARALLAAWGSDACVAVTNELPAYVLAEGVDGHRASCDVEAFFSEGSFKSFFAKYHGDRILYNNEGPKVGCSTSLVFSQPNTILRKYFDRIAPIISLEAPEYRGPVTIEALGTGPNGTAVGPTTRMLVRVTPTGASRATGPEINVTSAPSSARAAATA